MARITWKTTKMLIGAAVLVGLLTLAGISKEPAKVQVTYNPLPLNLPSVIMKSEGFLESAMGDTEVEYGTYLAGYLMTEAMAAGDLDIAAPMGGTSAVTSKAGGRDIKLVAVYGRAPKGFAIVVPANSSLKDVGDLVGKRVGAPIGTEVHYLLAKALAEKGLKTKAVTLVNMLVPDAVTALLAGEVDAAVVVEPVMSKLVSAGKIRVLRDGEGLIAGATFIAVRGDFFRKYPETVKDFLRAHLRSLEYARQNPDKAATLVAGEVNLPEPLVKKIVPKYAFQPKFDESILAELESTAEFLFEEGIIRRRVNIGDLVDDSLIEEVLLDTGK